MNNNNNYNYNNANPLDKSPPGGRKKPTKPKSIKEKGEKISSPKLDPVINLPSFPIITETPIFSLGYNPVDKPFTGNNGVFSTNNILTSTCNSYQFYDTQTPSQQRLGFVSFDAEIATLKLLISEQEKLKIEYAIDHAADVIKVSELNSLLAVNRKNHVDLQASHLEVAKLKSKLRSEQLNYAI